MKEKKSISPNENEVLLFWSKAYMAIGWEGTSAILGQQSSEALLPPAFQFSDNHKKADDMASRVLTGKVTSVSTPKSDFEEAGVALPSDGDLSIVCDGNGMPVALIQDNLVEVVNAPGEKQTMVVEHFDCIFPLT